MSSTIQENEAQSSRTPSADEARLDLQVDGAGVLGGEGDQQSPPRGREQLDHQIQEQEILYQDDDSSVEEEDDDQRGEDLVLDGSGAQRELILSDFSDKHLQKLQKLSDQQIERVRLMALGVEKSTQAFKKLNKGFKQQTQQLHSKV